MRGSNGRKGKKRYEKKIIKHEIIVCILIVRSYCTHFINSNAMQYKLTLMLPASVVLLLATNALACRIHALPCTAPELILLNFKTIQLNAAPSTKRPHYRLTDGQTSTASRCDQKQTARWHCQLHHNPLQSPNKYLNAGSNDSERQTDEVSRKKYLDAVDAVPLSRWRLSSTDTLHRHYSKHPVNTNSIKSSVAFTQFNADCLPLRPDTC